MISLIHTIQILDDSDQSDNEENKGERAPAWVDKEDEKVMQIAKKQNNRWKKVKVGANDLRNE